MIRLLIFDLDGTLVDTSQDITNALNHALVPEGINPLTNEQTRRLVGDGITRLIEKIIGNEDLMLVKKIRERFISFYEQHIADYSKPYPGVIDTLRSLDGFKKAIVTNKLEALSRKLLLELKMLSFFDLIVGGDTTPEKKPSPLPVIRVLEELGIKPEEALLIGDGTTDIEAGKKAGLKTVAVGYGYRPKELLQDADFFIEKDLSELIPVLERLNSYSS
ncbi:MAG: HAD-IA family hydrolase [Nitrospirae bacterium]|nr:HAD-IA family hydrolase [Nitrospirota bacterium]